MPWDSSDRRAELPPDWPKIRAERLKKDDHRCTWKLPSGKRCPRDATDVDHRGDKHDHSMRNLRSLCADHHKQRTQAQARSAKRRGSKARPSEAHPGRVS